MHSLRFPNTYDAFPDGFSLSTDALEVGLRFPFHPVIEACLDEWRISPSQMAPNSWRYMVAFIREYHGSRVDPRLVHSLLPLMFGAGRLDFSSSRMVEDGASGPSGLLDRSRLGLSCIAAPPIDVLIKAVRERPLPEGEKHPDMEGGEPPRKKTKLAVSKRKSATGGTSERARHNKGKESAEAVEPPSHLFTLRELCEVDD
ncbi:hypothetical protein BHE74_00045696 [Ensete ventricosum]|nr:hypothetical protein GW17_00061257 [Ensete ventricosum]RWW48242.1 hypothetical protein BHE74_00045696 [Ensete ventricosum]